MIVPSSVRTSTHAVFPPNLVVRSPGTAMDPRVPQKRTNKDLPPFSFRGDRVGAGGWRTGNRIASPSGESRGKVPRKSYTMFGSFGVCRGELGIYQANP